MTGLYAMSPPDPHDQQTWRFVVWLSSNWAWIISGVLAIVIALLRAYFEHVEITRRDVAEALICGLFVMVSKPVMAHFGINDDLAMFTGAVVGFLGAKFFRPGLELLARMITSRGRE